MKRLILSCLVTAAVLDCAAGARADAGAGTTAANFLKVPVAAIPTAMAEAYTAMVGPDSILYNPAALGLMSYSSFSGSHNQYLQGITQEYATLNWRFPFGTFGAAYSALSSGQIDAYDSDDMPAGKTSTSHSVMTVSYAQSWPHFRQDARHLDPMLATPSWTRVSPVTDYRPRSYRVAAGVSVKKITETLDTESSSAQAFDAGLMLLLPGHFQFGLSALNVGGKEKMVNESFQLPSSVRLGMATDFHTVNDVMIFTLASDLVKYRDSAYFNNTGVEVDVMRLFQFRVGYRTSKDTGSRMCGGIGMNFDKLTDKDSMVLGFRADYSYVDYGDLGTTQRIGVQFIW